MDEDTNPVEETTGAPAEATEEPTPAEGAEKTAAEEEKPEAAPFDLDKEINDAPAERLRKHPKFAGMVGAEKQAWRQQWEAEQKARDETAAREQAAEEMREMARRNPVAFADKWLGSEEAKAQQARLRSLESGARQAIAHQVGAAFHAIEEWAVIRDDPDALAQLAEAVQGKGDQEIPAFNAKAVELIAERRAQARLEAWKKTELAKEREALKAEITAEVLQGTSRPDLVRAARNAQRGSWEDLPLGPDFDREYERNVLRRR